MSTYKVITFGCKVNQYESAGLAEGLRSSGWTRAGDGEPVDLCIVDTCTVTGRASMQARQAVRRAVRANPGARVVVTGCYAQTEPEALSQIEGVTAVIGQVDKHTIPELTGNPDRSPPREIVSRHADIHRETVFHDLPVSTFDSRTRPFLKVQDGCNAFCTYCIVPHARGRSRSMPVDSVLENLRRYNIAGYREVVLTGIHLGYYGQDLAPPTDLYRLLEQIAASAFGGRIRLSSIEPLELTDDIIDLVRSTDRFCRHFHMPLQSGDNAILKRMHRPYTAELFQDRVTRIAAALPDAAIGVDTLIGFPGEDREAFENTYNLIRELPVAYLHVFPYSRRKGTPAHDYPDQIPAETVKRRCEKMRALGARKREAFYRRNLQKQADVLVESQRDAATGMLKGLTSNYLPVLIEGADSLKENLVKVSIDMIDDKPSVYGSLI